MIHYYNFPQGAMTCEQLKAELLKLNNKTLPLYASGEPKNPHEYERVRCFRTQTWYPGSRLERTAFVLYTEQAAMRLPQFFIPLDENAGRDANRLLTTLENKCTLKVEPSWPVLAAFVDEDNKGLMVPIGKIEQQELYIEKKDALVPCTCFSVWFSNTKYIKGENYD